MNYLKVIHSILVLVAKVKKVIYYALNLIAMNWRWVVLLV